MAEIAEARARVIERAQRDPGYRARLVADPSAAIEEELGLKVPDGIEINVVEETPSAVTLVLPLQGGDVPTAELGERELESVTGGYGLSSQLLSNTQTP
jgi:hypothetical protein